MQHGVRHRATVTRRPRRINPNPVVETLGWHVKTISPNSRGWQDDFTLILIGGAELLDVFWIA